MPHLDDALSTVILAATNIKAIIGTRFFWDGFRGQAPVFPFMTGERISVVGSALDYKTFGTATNYLVVSAVRLHLHTRSQRSPVLVNGLAQMRLLEAACVKDLDSFADSDIERVMLDDMGTGPVETPDDYHRMMDFLVVHTADST